MRAKRLRRDPLNPVSSSRWAAYAAAGAASALASVNSAEADIHYSLVLNQPFNDTDPALGVAVRDFFTLGGTATFSLIHNLGAGGGFAGFFIGGNVASFAGVINPAATSYRYPFKLASNLPVSAQAFVANVPGQFASLAANSGYPLSQWTTSGTGFIGFKFDGGAGVQYGWARLTMNDGAPTNNFTLVDFAYADPGQAIMTGEIPEPGSLALLALGGAGLLAWRRQRAQASKVA